MHKELLTYHSPYFRAALSGNSEDAKANIVRTDKALFWAPELVIHWLYRDRLPNEHADARLYSTWTERYWAVVEVYVFCHKYDIPVLRRKAMDHLYKMIEEKGLPEYRNLRRAFDWLPLKSSLCRFLVDIICEKADETHWKAPFNHSWLEEEQEFYEAILRRYSQITRLGRKGRGSLDICDYHEHANNEERQACAAERAA
jgi:hypothetical protein